MKTFFNLIFFLFVGMNPKAQTYGCTDSLANNYNANATANDGSCIYNSANVVPLSSNLLPIALDETSGLTFWNNMLWSLNDDADNNLYAIDTGNFNNYTAYPLNEPNIDWEEISQDDDYFYIGDFGNNVSGNRTDLKILKIEKNSLLQNNPNVDTINFSYSTQTNFNPTAINSTDFDCEAFVITADSIYLFTKEWISNHCSVYSLPNKSGSYSANFISSYNVNGLVTGATQIQNSRAVVLSGYSTVMQPFVLLLYDYQGFNFFSGNKRIINVNLPFHQTEGIATVNGLKYYLSNEKLVQTPINIQAKIHEIDLTPYLSHYLNSVSGSFDISENPYAINIYPNPTTDFINVKWNTGVKVARIKIFNISGKEVMNQIVTEKYFQIDIRSFEKGIYFLSVNDSVFRKVVKM